MYKRQHRKFNSLSTIDVDGVCYDSLPEMKSAIFGFYKSSFIELEQWRPFVDGLPVLQSIEKEFIEMPFNVDEISKALSDCCGDLVQME